jgi:hypothetical protein
MKRKFQINAKYLKWGLLLVIALVISIILGYVIYKAYKSSKPHKEEDTELAEMDNQLENIEGADMSDKIARVGKEYLFTTDLEYYAYLRLKKLDEINREEAINESITYSVMLQLGEDEGWIELTQEIFNNPFKDNNARGDLINEVREAYDENYKSGTYVEFVSVWFNNAGLGPYAEEHGVEAAKSLAKEKIDAVYAQVVNEGKSMEEAVQLLVNDESLVELDVNYKGNAYELLWLEYEIVQNSDTAALRDSMYNFLLSATEGDVSEIFLEAQIDINGDTEELYYTFYRLKLRRQSFDTVYDWANEKRKDLKVEIY